jgi:hypothetical protein
MSPTKLRWIHAILFLLLAAPVAAEDGSEPAAEAPVADALAETPAAAAATLDEGMTEAEATLDEGMTEVAETADAMADEAAADAATDVLYEPTEAETASLDTPEAAPDPVPAALAPMDDASNPPALGAVGYDSEGRQGRIHIVVGGDTLWDISNAYLGTPWVWPSIWNDNGDIANPHVIHPGDRIWITPNEMRKLTEEEAEAFLAGGPPPAAPEEPAWEPEPEPAPPVIADPIDRGSVRIAGREVVGLITAEQLEAAASIVASVPERVLLSQEDDVFVGLGEADVDAGDKLTVFRTHEKVFDPDTGVLLGYHVEFLGWLEVEETFPETARAEVKMSTGELEQGDRVIPREPIPDEIALQASPLDVEGKISFFPKKRVLMGFSDFVYLNRGTLDGLEEGAPLEVYRPGYAAHEAAREERVHVPDRVIANLLVVRADSQSSVALVTHSSTELSLGDRFRGNSE